MATSQGMCKNCGSLIMFDDRDNTCECVFCHCVFSSKEAVEILENPEGRTFANEKFEATSDSHHYTTRVYSTESLEKQIAREEVKRSQEGSSKAKNDEFEVTAKDVKAPKKLTIGLYAATVAFVAIVLAISIPMYSSRMKITDSIEKNVTKIYDGNIAGHSIYGQSCQTFNLVTNDELDKDGAQNVYDNYCAQRSDAGKKDSKDVTVVIYCDGGIYTVDDSGVNFAPDEK